MEKKTPNIQGQDDFRLFKFLTRKNLWLVKDNLLFPPVLQHYNHHFPLGGYEATSMRRENKVKPSQLLCTEKLLDLHKKFTSLL